MTRRKTVVVDVLTDLIIVLPADTPDSPPFQLWVRGFHSRGATRISVLDDTEEERPVYVAVTSPSEIGVESI